MPVLHNLRGAGWLAAIMVPFVTAVIWWWNLSPSVSPKDVLLIVTVKPASPDLQAFLPKYPWELVVEVGSADSHALYQSEKRRYRNDVYPFSNGHRLAGEDFMLGWRDGHTVVPEGFGNIGANGWTLSRAIQSLKGEGYLARSYSETSAFSPGFSHMRTDRFTRIRYHLDGEGTPGRIAVVYVHDEKRWGKDLSWVKVVYAEPSQ